MHMKTIHFPFALAALLLLALSANAQTKYVVVEEGTGTWCQWCPSGTAELHDLDIDYPEVIGIAVHNGDTMELEAYDDASEFDAFPLGHIDREYINQDVATWEGHVQSQLAIAPPAAVNVSYNYNAVAGEVEVTIEAAFTQSLTGNYRIAGVLIEDGVHGTSSDFDQSNSW